MEVVWCLDKALDFYNVKELSFFEDINKIILILILN